jgi:hypothetical protein
MSHLAVVLQNSQKMMGNRKTHQKEQRQQVL